MIDGVRWLVYGAVAAFLVLILALFWPGSSNRVQQREVSPDTVSQVPLPASGTTSMPAAGELSNPFASNNFAAPSLAESAVKNDDLRHEPAPALTREGSATDWSQWRKSDERLRSYLGGPPGPGKPAE